MLGILYNWEQAQLNVGTTIFKLSLLYVKHSKIYLKSVICLNVPTSYTYVFSPWYNLFILILFINQVIIIEIVVYYYLLVMYAVISVTLKLI